MRAALEFLSGESHETFQRLQYLGGRGRDRQNTIATQTPGSSRTVTEFVAHYEHILVFGRVLASRPICTRISASFMCSGLT